MNICKVVIPANMNKEIQDFCFKNKIYWFGSGHRYYENFAYICFVKYYGCKLAMLKGDSLFTFEKCAGIEVTIRYLRDNFSKMIEKYK